MRVFRGDIRFPGLPTIYRELRVGYLWLALGLLLLIVLPLSLVDDSIHSPNLSLLVSSPLLLVNFFLAFLYSIHTRQKLHREQLRFYDTIYRVSENNTEKLFPALVTLISEFLGADYVHIGRFNNARGEIFNALAICHDGQVKENVELELAGAPCVTAFEGAAWSVDKNLHHKFPDSTLVSDLQAVSYLGYPLRDGTGEVVGVISAFGRKRLRHGQGAVVLLALLAQHASSELERRRVQKAMERMAYHDPLTEMPNWRFLESDLLQRWARPIRVANLSVLSFLMLIVLKTLIKPWVMRPETIC